MIRIPPALALSTLDAAPDAMLIIDTSGTICFTNRQVSALFGYPHDEIIGEVIEKLLPERFRAQHIGHRERYVDNLRMRPMGAGLELFGRRRRRQRISPRNQLEPHSRWGQNARRGRHSRCDGQQAHRGRADCGARCRGGHANATGPDSPIGPIRPRAAFSRPPATICDSRCRPWHCSMAPCAASSRPERCRSLGAARPGDRRHVAGCSTPCSTSASSSPGQSNPSRRISPSPPSSRNCALEFCGIASSKGLQLEIESCNDAVHSDPSLVEQILRNLLSNAVKYTREGWVRLRCLHEAALVRIEVLDTGIGIPAAQLPYIYDEFYQVGRCHQTFRAMAMVSGSPSCSAW